MDKPNINLNIRPIENGYVFSVTVSVRDRGLSRHFGETYAPTIVEAAGEVNEIINNAPQIVDGLVKEYELSKAPKPYVHRNDAPKKN